jgi:DNA-binding NtrC family response regulator
MPCILLVDDDRFVRGLFEKVFRRQGFDVVCAANGRDAIIHFRLCPVDVVVTDIVMPEMEGLESITEMHRLKPEVPIIAISGGDRLSADGYLEKAIACGAVAALSKPFTHEDLLAAVQKALDQRAANPPVAAATPASAG